MWTFPVLVDGPFGVVSAGELIGILLFAAYVVWAVSAYAMESRSLETRLAKVLLNSFRLRLVTMMQTTSKF